MLCSNALFEQEGCATFIVLFYRPLPDSWRNFKTTTCSPFHTTSFATRPALCPLTRSKAGQGFNCKFKPVSLLLREKTDTVSAAGDSHLHLTSHWPPPAPPQFHRQFCCHSARSRCHFTAHSLSSLPFNCVFVCVCPGSINGYLKRLTTTLRFKVLTRLDNGCFASGFPGFDRRPYTLNYLLVHMIFKMLTN